MATFLYNTILTPAQFTVSNTEFTLAIGGVTIVKMTVSGALTFNGLIVPGGPVDGMVATFAIQTSGFNTTFAHDSISASDQTHRFWNSAVAAVVISGFGAVTYRYDSTLGTAPIGRWFQISRT